MTAFDTDTVQAIAAVASTVGSSVLAIVALVFSYRQNVGWRPVAFTRDAVVSDFSENQPAIFRVTIEVWNRRKYPLLLERIDVMFCGIVARENIGEDITRMTSSDVVDVVNPHERWETQLQVDLGYKTLDEN